MRHLAQAGTGLAIRVLAFVFVVVFTCAVPALAQAPSAPGAELTLLAKPISPGSIALLVEHPTESLAQQRVKEALADSRAEVRTVAARIIFDMGMRGLLPDVQAALAREQDPIAGAEELRAWMTLVPSPATFSACVDAALRLGYPATSTVVDTLARLNAPELLSFVPRLLGDTGLPNAIMTVTTTNHAARMPIVRNLAAYPELLDPLLVAMHKDGDHVPSEMLVSLLRSEDAKARVVGIWYVVLCLAMDGSVLTPEVKAALDPLIDANPTQVTWEAFGLELVSRAEGRPRRVRRWTDLAKSRKPPSARHSGDEPLFERLTRTELEDYYEATGSNRSDARFYHEGGLERLRREQAAPRSGDRPAWITPNVGVRTVPPFAPGLWTDLLQMTGCQPRRGWYMAADVAYRPDGRPRQIVPGDTILTEPCRRFARVLFSLIVAEDARPQPARFSDVLVLPIQSNAIACADRSVLAVVEDRRRRIAGGATGPRSGDPSFKPPKQLEEIPSFYTDEARKRRLEGYVVVDAILTPEGCFSQGSVVSSPSAMLSGPALFSIVNWRYAPGTEDGAPVPARMQVTVQFKLP